MSNSMIFAGHFENMQIRSLRRHFSTCQHWFCFWIQHTKLPLIKVSNQFLHKMPILINFSDFFLDKRAYRMCLRTNMLMTLFPIKSTYLHVSHYAR